MPIEYQVAGLALILYLVLPAFIEPIENMLDFYGDGEED